MGFQPYQLTQYYYFANFFDIWLKKKRFMLHFVPKNGSCSLTTVWNALQLNIPKNSDQLKEKFPTFEFFLEQTVSQALLINSTNSILLNIQKNGEKAL